METDKTKPDEAVIPHENPGRVDEAGTIDVPREVNGPKGPEPTRYGDWEQKGRCSDF